MEGGPIRAAIMADTHGVLRPEVERILETCDVIIHAGDFDNQMLYHKLNVDQPLYAVRGNNDRGWSIGLPTVKRFELGGVKFIMAHERVDIPSVLPDIQVVIFGHSHMYYQQEINGRLWLNPGGCGYKRFTLPLSMAVMTIEDGTYEVETLWLEKGYGTPGAALAQGKNQKGRNPQEGYAKSEKPRAGRYEKQQRRYKQKTGKEKAESRLPEDDQPENYLPGKVPGPPSSPGEDRDRLFLIAKIQRLKHAGEPRDWIIGNLGRESESAGLIYDLCCENPGAGARHILELLKAAD